MRDTVKLKNRIVKIIIFSVAVIIIAGASIADAVRRNGTRLATDSFISMGSAVTAKVYGAKSELATNSVREKIKKLDGEELSQNRIGSCLSRVNEGAGKYSVEVSDEFLAYLKACMEIADATGGAFNPAFGAVIDLWDVDGENPKVPSDEVIARKLALCDYGEIEINGNRIYLPREGMKLHLGAAGKGIACDGALSELQKYGDSVYGAVISVGGSVLTYGKNPNGGIWKVGIRNPSGALSDTVAEIEVEGTRFFSTSGSYEKYFEKDGEKYHHIFDTSTGKPVKTTLASVTVVAPDGLLSDALSTACFVLGEEKSLEILEKYGCDAVFIYSDSRVRVTKGLEGRFSLTGKAAETYEVIGAVE